MGSWLEVATQAQCCAQEAELVGVLSCEVTRTDRFRLAEKEVCVIFAVCARIWLQLCGTLRHVCEAPLEKLSWCACGPFLVAVRNHLEVLHTPTSIISTNFRTRTRISGLVST